MAWAAIILLTAAEGCWAQYRYQNPTSWGNGGTAQNPYGAQNVNPLGQLGNLYGSLRWPWYGFGGSGCGPCSLQPPPPCQCLQPQASSPPESKTGLNSMEMDPPPPPPTTTTTTTPPPPPPEKRQPSMPEYIPPPPQPPCPTPVQSGCTCIPGMLSVACLPVCMQGLLGGQAASQYNSGQATSQYNPGQAASQYNPGQALTAPGYTALLRQYSNPSQTANQPTLYSSQTLNQGYSGGQNLNSPVLYSSQTVNQPLGYNNGQNFNQPLGYSGGQNLNQPTLYSGQTLNQPYSGAYPSQTLNPPTIYSSQTLNQQSGYPAGQNLNQPSLYSSQTLNQPSLYGSPNLNQPIYPSQTVSQPGSLYPGSSLFGDSMFGTKRSFGQSPLQDLPKQGSKKMDKTKY